MREELNKILYEKLLIQYLFNDEEVRNRLIPYLNPEVFMLQNNSKVIKEIIEFMNKHEHFPRINELKISISNSEVYDHLISIMDIDVSEYDKLFILGELEEFYRKSLVANIFVEASSNLSKNSEDLQDTPDKLREALSFTFDTNIGLSFMEDSEKMFNSLHDKDKVMRTNIKSFDDLIEGGLHEKSLNLILAATNMGKSLIMCSMACNFLLDNKNVLYLSLEMSEEKISERILANLYDIEIGHLKLMDKKSFQRKHDIIKKHLKSNMVVIQRSPKSVNANKLRQILKELKMKKNFKPDVIIVDYLGLMSTNNKSKDSNSYTQMKEVSEELRAVMVEENVVGLSAIQTNRSGIGISELDLTNISESIGTAATADLIWGVTQTDELRISNKFIWSILKNRYGINGTRIFVGVNYPKMRIFDCNEEETNKTVEKNTTLLDDAATEVLSTMRENKKQKKQAMGIE